jgi:hypothetical protein
MAGARRDYKNVEQIKEDFKNQKRKLLGLGGAFVVAIHLQRHRDNGWCGRPQDAAYVVFICCTGSLPKPSAE